jgi:preprotein translocase subunit SecB
MKASPLSLRDVTFLNVHVQINADFTDDIDDFNFDGVNFTWGIRHGKQNDEGTDWWVGVEMAVDNSAEKQCPYKIYIKAAGMFSIDEHYDPARRESFVYDSGASLIYGAIREMVMNITSRSARGSLMLPTASLLNILRSNA